MSIHDKAHLSVQTDVFSHKGLHSLPHMILVNVIEHIRQRIEEDGYLCDLRLVNRQFNEAVLHCLVFRGHPRAFYPEHYMSCYGVCRRKACTEVGVSNHYYSRFYLQGRIIVRQDKDMKRKKFHNALGSALALFQNDMKRLNTTFPITRSYLSNSRSLYSTSANPLLADKMNILLCDATVEYSKMLTRGLRGTYASWLDRNIHHERDTQFWLRNLACYLGDEELLSYYSKDIRDKGLVAHNHQEFEKLLGMAARRGHEVLFGSLITHASPGDTNMILALCGACHSGSTRIANTILQSVPTEAVQGLCSQVLTRLRESQTMPPSYFQIANQMINNLNIERYNKTQVCFIMFVQAHLGATDQVQLLLQRFRGLTFWPPPYSPETSLSALWSACINGDLECVQILLQHGFISETASERIVEDLCLQCVQAAIRSNSLAIYEELYRCMNRSIDASPFEFLAGMDGTVPAMVKRLDVEPNILEKRVGGMQIGQWALMYAATRLRVENVEFLLGKGMRLDECHTQKGSVLCAKGLKAFQIEWRERRAHEVKYQQVQRLLQDYGVVQLEVRL